ncbi:DUF5658 family protein [Niallia sp. 03133]|uniref:DUF5658 family protein n=1 Tax=Niallia sp. 03133 TaxID=3458060 RepID=UPI004044AE51
MKILFILISFLNFIDGLFTYVGMHLQLITEFNPLMETIWNISPFLFLFCKISLSIVLFCIARLLFITKYQKAWTLFLLIPVGLYGSIMILHLNWIVTAEITV